MAEGSIELAWEDYTAGGDQDYDDLVVKVSFSSPPDNPPGDNNNSDYAIRAEGKVILRGRGDYDGEPLDQRDDARIYAGRGFAISGKPILPVQRDSYRNPLVDTDNREILVDKAVTVAQGYSTSWLSYDRYSGLIPPQIVEAQTVEIPDYEITKQELLDVVLGDANVTSIPYYNLRNLNQWENNTPLTNGDHSSQVRLIGQLSEEATLESILDDNEVKTVELDEEYKFDSAIAATELEPGTHKTTITVTDGAGNVTATEVSFEVKPEGFSTVNGTESWGAKDGESILLGEKDGFVSQTSIPVGLGQAEGSRTLRFELAPLFNNTDIAPLKEDQLLIYLVDPLDPTQTLLDNGTPGSAVFSLAGEDANFTPGLVTVEIIFDNPELVRFSLTPQVLSGGANQAPVFEPIAPISVMPGGKVEIDAKATDPDGDTVTYLIESEGQLPTGTLEGNGKLIFNPTPEEIGNYKFTLIATDGIAETRQDVTLDVVPDPVTTTRISGILLDTDGTPLDGVLLELGRITTTTDGEGKFTLELPPELLPTESLNIEVASGDIFFDPEGTGNQTINFQRSQYDRTTGTGTDNPRRHPNLVSSFLDGSAIYGSDDTRATALRLNDGTGKLKVSDGDLLPFNDPQFFPDGTLENANSGRSNPDELFVSGDVNINENIALASIHTLFVREHNRLAEEIAAEDPTLDGETIYQKARNLVKAQVQHITYSEYLPLLLGEASLNPYEGYKENVDPSVSGTLTKN